MVPAPTTSAVVAAVTLASSTPWIATATASSSAASAKGNPAGRRWTIVRHRDQLGERAARR